MRCRIVSSKEVYKESRFDGSYHNAESIVYDNVIKAHSSHNLAFYCSDIFTSGRNKRAYTSPEFGYPFLSNSDASSQNPFANCKYSSRKYGFDNSSLLTEGMILTGRVGAIGQTSIVPHFWETKKAMGSDNIIRIAVKPEYKNGFIYAYLSSKMGNLSFWKHATGGVQPFITDSMVGSLPIPDFAEECASKVDRMIHESLSLRDKASIAIEKAHALIENEFSEKPSLQRSKVVSNKDILQSHLRRFEAKYHNSEGEFYDYFIRSHFEYELLGNLAEKIWRPDIFKRIYVTNGIPFLSGSDIMQCIPQSEKRLSRRTPSKESFLVEDRWILVPRSGTIGDVTITTSHHAEKLVTEDVIRIVPKKDTPCGFLFAFLSSSVGKALIQRPIFGSVIQHVESPHLERIPIPCFAEETVREIDSLAETYRESWGKAASLELEAISIIENTIESWNK